MDAGASGAQSTSEFRVVNQRSGFSGISPGVASTHLRAIAISWPARRKVRDLLLPQRPVRRRVSANGPIRLRCASRSACCPALCLVRTGFASKLLVNAVNRQLLSDPAGAQDRGAASRPDVMAA